MNTKKIFFTLLSFLSISFIFSGCVKHDFDSPPSNCDDINITATYSIEELKAFLPNNQDTLKLGDTVIIEGTVTSTDQYGNFYKELIIQDTSGAISIQIDDKFMFTKYPVGQRIYIKCGSMYLGDDYDIVKLGGLFLEDGTIKFGRIVGEEIIKEHFFQTCDNNQIIPEIIKIDEINDDQLYQLVRIEEVQFESDELGATYADGIAQTSQNRNIIDKNGNTLIVRTSGFASFARDSLPKESGYITGILGKYNADYQIYIRNTDDVIFDQARFAE